MNVVVGSRFHMSLVPIVEANTKYFDAGPVVIAVESRVLSDGVVQNAYRDDAAATAIFEELGLTSFDDDGPSFHVIERGSSTERLRFDMFEGQPHYHYIHGLEDHTAVIYDPHAQGDMVGWALDRLRHHLPEMLRYASADAVADDIDPVALGEAVARVTDYVDGIRAVQKQPEVAR